MVYLTCSSVHESWYRLERPSAAGCFENEAQFSFKRRRQIASNLIEQERQCGSIIGAMGAVISS